jgi:SsrA-binding protein
VKSLRCGHVSLDEAYAKIKGDELWLIGCDIAEYFEANRYNHNPKRIRKLLLHRREIKRFAHRAFEKGLTLVPLQMHFKRGLAKVVIGICRGKQKHDKRQAMKTAEVKRDLARMMMKRR